MKLFDYDDTSVDSIFAYAKQLEGMTFNQIITAYEENPIKVYIPKNMKSISTTSSYAHESIAYNANKSDLKNPKAKGQLGVVLEKYYFGYDPNGNQEADFNKVGIELKQTPIDISKKGELRAGERLSITNISYREPVIDDFYQSHVWDKIKCILLVHYIRDKSKERFDYQIKFVNLFTPPKQDLQIIISDYNKINAKIKAGLAHELSEGDTLYLGACTKGKTAIDSMVPQFYGTQIFAKKRNFCFKVSYMNFVLNNYVLKNNVPCDTILKDEFIGDFEEYIISKINRYSGYTDKELCKILDLKYTNNKAQWKTLVYRILGIRNNKAAEFEKANVNVRTIRIEENGKNVESISFSNSKFKDLAKETWEESAFFNFLDTTKFFFVIFKKIGDCYQLSGAQFWHISYDDMNIVRKEWEAYVNVIKNNIEFKFSTQKTGKVEVNNNLPKKSETKIIHMRPHSKKSAYKLHNGYEYGNIRRDADELPNGEWMTKQSFWLNNDYVLKQLKYK